MKNKTIRLTKDDLMAELVIELKNSRNTLSLEDFAQVIKEAIHKDDLEILIKELKEWKK